MRGLAMQMTKVFMIVDEIMSDIENEVKMHIEQGFEIDDVVDNELKYADMIFVLCSIYDLSTAQSETIFERYGYDVLKKKYESN